MSDTLDDLRAVHEQQIALVPGHWTEQAIGRAVAEIERLRAAIKPFAEATWDELPDNTTREDLQRLRDAYEQPTREG